MPKITDDASRKQALAAVMAKLKTEVDTLHAHHQAPADGEMLLGGKAPGEPPQYYAQVDEHVKTGAYFKHHAK